MTHIDIHSVTQNHKGTERKIVLPLIYALLENKTEDTYTKVIEVTLSLATEFGFPVRHPHTVMSKFELAILNSVKIHFGDAAMRLCLFHLHQIVYRKIQAEGLQQQYLDKRTIFHICSTHCMTNCMKPSFP